MKSVGLFLLIGAAAATSLWLTSRNELFRYSVDGPPVMFILTSSGPNDRFTLSEPCEESERRVRPGDLLHEREVGHPWMPVVWTRARILRDGQVAEHYSVGGLAYFGVLAGVAVLPALVALLGGFAFPSKKPARE